MCCGKWGAGEAVEGWMKAARKSKAGGYCCELVRVARLAVAGQNSSMGRRLGFGVDWGKGKGGVKSVRQFGTGGHSQLREWAGLKRPVAAAGQSGPQPRAFIVLGLRSLRRYQQCDLIGERDFLD